MRIGAMEAGGTKFVCGIGSEDGIVEDSFSFPTGQPEGTLSRAISYFKDHEVDAIGIGSFGPIDLKPESPTYGYVTSTPKPGWSHTDVLGKMKSHMDIPYGWDTDVNAALEKRLGERERAERCAYYTVGTGIGLGLYAEGRLVHGLVHPEGGHVPVKRHPEDAFAGACPYHGDCLEGLAGPALEARWG